jgi:hypothetical protein
LKLLVLGKKKKEDGIMTSMYNPDEIDLSEFLEEDIASSNEPEFGDDV